MPGSERFVPQRTGQLTRDLADLPWPHGDDGDEGDRDEGDGGEERPEQFRAFARLLAALYHYEFYEREQRAVDAWEAIADGGPGHEDAATAITAELTGLLDGANYVPVTMAELDDALSRESLIPLRLDVDLTDYDEVLIYRRGSHQSTVTVPKLRGLRQEEKTITVDERVVVHTRVKPAAWFEEQGIDPGDRNLVPGHVSLKQFQNVPRADIEMLLPSTRVRFRPIDTILVGVPALVSGVAVLTTKLLPTIGLIALLIGAGLGFRDESPELDQTALVILLGGALTLGGFLFRQWTKLKNRRVNYLKTLSENLYFRTLADGPGVLHTLLATAEQQEVIEVLLAYRFLLAEPGGRTAAQLDTAVEAWLHQACQQEIDFEVDDAVGKLRRLEVVEGSEQLRPVPLATALQDLDRRWDDLFRHQPDDEPSGGGGVAAADANGSDPS
ncbi:MAG: TMEM143 family protein, partial [Actinomycetota bacterium]